MLADLSYCIDVNLHSPDRAAATGTPLYRAPETLGTPRKFSEQSDMYSFGMVVLGTLLRRDVQVSDFVADATDTDVVEEKA